MGRQAGAGTLLVWSEQASLRRRHLSKALKAGIKELPPHFYRTGVPLTSNSGGWKEVEWSQVNSSEENTVTATYLSFSEDHAVSWFENKLLRNRTNAGRPHRRVSGTRAEVEKSGHIRGIFEGR